MYIKYIDIKNQKLIKVSKTKLLKHIKLQTNSKYE